MATRFGWTRVGSDEDVSLLLLSLAILRIRATKFRGVDVDGWFEADAGGSALIGEIAAADGVNGD